MKKRILLLFISMFFMFLLADKESWADGNSIIECRYGYYIVIEEMDINGYVLGQIYKSNKQPVSTDKYWIDYIVDIPKSGDVIRLKSCNDNYYGFFDTKFDYLQQPVFDDVSYRTQNDQPLIAVSKDQKWGFCCRKDGEIIIPCIYDDYYDFENGFALVCISDFETTSWKDTWKLIDLAGNPVNFEEGYMPITLPDSNGTLIVQLQSENDVKYYFAYTSGYVVSDKSYDTLSEIYQYHYDEMSQHE